MGEMVSIVIPAYNAAATLAETLESALNQTWRNLEVLVIDDGSTDDTAAIARRYAERDGRCRCFHQANTGQAAAMNKGVELARGACVAFLDADDLYAPDKVEKQVKALEAAGADVAMTQIRRFMVVDGKWVDRPVTPLPSWSEREDYLRTVLFLDSFQMALFTTALIRREVLLESGMFDASLPTAKDWDLWLRMAARGYRFVNVQEPLYFYRKHPGSHSLKHGAYRTLNTQWKILAKLRADFPALRRDLKKAERERLFEHVQIFLYHKEFDEALKLIAKGCRSHRLFLVRTFYGLVYEILRKKFAAPS